MITTVESLYSWSVLTLLIVLGWSEPTAAQPIERPTDCTEAIAIGTIFIGHDCGEWASVLISGNVIIRKPWSRANRASRAVRLRERREGSPVTARRRLPFPTVTATDPIPWTVLHPQMRGTATGAGTTVDDLEVELRCEATPEQTIITNNGDETVIVTEIRSLAGPPVAGEEGAPDPDLAIAPGQTRIYETGPGADPASGGISSADLRQRPPVRRGSAHPHQHGGEHRGALRVLMTISPDVDWPRVTAD